MQLSLKIATGAIVALLSTNGWASYQETGSIDGADVDAKRVSLCS